MAENNGEVTISKAGEEMIQRHALGATREDMDRRVALMKLSPEERKVRAHEALSRIAGSNSQPKVAESESTIDDDSRNPLAEIIGYGAFAKLQRK